LIGGRGDWRPNWKIAEMTTNFWNAPVDGYFGDAANWTLGNVPGSAEAAVIDVSGDYTVSTDEGAGVSVASLRLGSQANLDVVGNSYIHVGTSGLTIGASSIVTDDSDIELAPRPAGGGGHPPAKETIDGLLIVGPGAVLQASTSKYDFGVEVTGGGTIQLAGSGAFVDFYLPGGTFTNTATIEGAGTISITAGGPGIPNANAGVIDANLTGEILTLTGVYETVGGVFNKILNSNVLEATNGGELYVETSVTGGLFASTGAGSSLVFDNVVAEGTVQASGGGSVTFTDCDSGFMYLSDDGSGVIEASGATLPGTFSLSGGGAMQVNASVLTGTLTAAAGSVFEFVSGANTLGPISLTQSVSLTGDAQVDDGASLTLQISLVNNGVLSLLGGADATTLKLYSRDDASDGDSVADREIVLSGAGSIMLSDSAENLIAPTSATDILENEGNTISGAGQIGGGSTMSITNGGVIDATGINALVLNVGVGKVTNQAKGLLEGTGSGGLSLAGGTFTDSGKIEALNGSSVTFGSGAVLTNNSGGTLTGGAWLATDTGDGAALTLSGPAITTLAATVELTGANSTFDTGSTALESSLSAIAAKGKLELLADRGWSGAEALTNDGLLQLGGGAFSAPGLTVNASGTVSGFGDVSGPVTNDGVVQAYRGTLDVSGDVSGSGTLKVWGSSTLIAGGTISASEGVLFATGLHATLKLGDPSAFASTISNWALSDTIDLAGTDAASAQITGDTLAIDIEGGDTLDYTLANAPTNVRIVLASDGDGGTNLTLYKAAAPAVARLTQAMAGLPPAAPAGAAHPDETTAGHLTLIAASRA
jgi:hypothetical protein